MPYPNAKIPAELYHEPKSWSRMKILAGAKQDNRLLRYLFVASDKMPLLMATYNNHPFAVEHFLAQGCPVDSKDSEGSTAFHYACSLGHIDIIRILITHNADWGVLDQQGATPMHLALSLQQFEAMAALVKSAQSLGLIDYQYLPLRVGFACPGHPVRNSSQLRQLLTDGTLSPNQPITSVPILDEYYKTVAEYHLVPLEAALAVADLQFVRLLVDCGADPNEELGEGRVVFHALFGSIPSDVISRYRQEPQISRIGLREEHLILTQIFEEIVARNPSGVKSWINQKDGEGRTAFHYAARKKNGTLCQILLQHGASPRESDNNGITPLMMSATLDPELAYTLDKPRARLDDHIVFFHNLYDDHSCLNFQPNFGLFSSSQKLIEFLEDLTRRDLKAKDSSGRDALDHAADCGDASLVDYLIRRDAQSSIDLQSWCNWKSDRSNLGSDADNQNKSRDGVLIVISGYYFQELTSWPSIDELKMLISMQVPPKARVKNGSPSSQHPLLLAHPANDSPALYVHNPPGSKYHIQGNTFLSIGMHYLSMAKRFPDMIDHCTADEVINLLNDFFSSTPIHSFYDQYDDHFAHFQTLLGLPFDPRFPDLAFYFFQPFSSSGHKKIKTKSPAHLAAAHCHGADYLRVFAQLKLLTNPYDSSHRTPLHVAVQSGYVANVKALLDVDSYPYVSDVLHTVTPMKSKSRDKGSGSGSGYVSSDQEDIRKMLLAGERKWREAESRRKETARKQQRERDRKKALSSNYYTNSTSYSSGTYGGDGGGGDGGGTSHHHGGNGGGISSTTYYDATSYENGNSYGGDTGYGGDSGGGYGGDGGGDGGG